MLFNPSRDQVRAFFCETWAKMRAHEPLSGLQLTAAEWIAEHPEYHALLEDPQAALAQDFSVETGQMNPFLHLSMHLSLAEQHSIDQPPGVKAALDRLTQQTGSLHEAMHLAMDCLGEMLWSAQRNQTEPNPLDYLTCLQQKGH
jgi:hypothetical protein